MTVQASPSPAAKKRKAAFRMKLAKVAKEFSHLDFNHRMAFPQSAPDPAVLACPLIRQALGDELDYGHLFAYLFRRFGYPNRGWDDYKDLTRYLLSTPHPGVILSVTPSVCGLTSLSFRVMAETSLVKAVEKYDMRERAQWELDALAAAEAAGLPDWMPEWVDLASTELRAAWGGAPTPEKLTWQASMRFAFPLKGTPLYAATSRAHLFYKKLNESYAKVVPCPDYLKRGHDWNLWAEDDPLRPLAEAAYRALSNLLEPVGVRDAAITAKGEVPYQSKMKSPAKGAGYASGALGNHAPRQMAELYGLANKLGKGNLGKGLAKILETASA